MTCSTHVMKTGKKLAFYRRPIGSFVGRQIDGRQVTSFAQLQFTSEKRQFLSVNQQFLPVFLVSSVKHHTVFPVTEIHHRK